MLEDIQGIRPQNLAVVLGNGKIATLKTNDYFDHYLQLKKMFLTYHQNFDPLQMPEIGKGNFMEWNSLIQGLRQESDDLSQIAGITNAQITKLKANGITTMTELAQTEREHIPKIGDKVFQRLKIQTQLQILSGETERPQFQIITDPNDPQRGLSTLPPPSKKSLDIFFDIEGYPLAEGGLEYLLGAMTNEGGKRSFHTWWSNDDTEEKVNFELEVVIKIIVGFKGGYFTISQNHS